MGFMIAAFIVATSAMSASQPAAAISVASAPHIADDVAPDPELAADTERCLAVSSIVEDAALAVEADRRERDSAVVSRLRSAESQIGAQLDPADARLGAALSAMRDAIIGLRHAVETNIGVGVATDAVIHRIDDLDAACQARLRS